jgi:hypothetical protein
LKFAGDAVFAEWRVSKKKSNTSRDEKDEIDQCVHTAATCGAAIVAKCSDYPIFGTGDENTQIATLNVHCGLAFGKMAGLHVGNDYNRREYIVLGESIDQVAEACEAATYGELFASPEAYEILQRRTSKKGLSFTRKQKKKLDKPIIIASRNQCFFEKKTQRKFNSKNRRSLTQKNEYSVPFDKMNITSLRYLRKLLSLYVHPVVVSDESMLTNSMRNVKVTQERHRSEAELRSVYTMFIKPIIQAELTNDPQKNEEMYKLLNDVLDIVTSVLDGFKGHLRQFIVDDKGRVFLLLLHEESHFFNYLLPLSTFALDQE